MMPGVVAGYPLKPDSPGGPAGPGIMTLEALEAEFIEFSKEFGVGSVDPSGFSAVPGAAAVPGAKGELLSFFEAQEPSTGKWAVYIEVAGQYTSIPFSAVKIGGTTLLAGTFILDSFLWPEATIFSQNITAYGRDTPAATPGQNIIEFI